MVTEGIDFSPRFEFGLRKEDQHQRTVRVSGSGNERNEIVARCLGVSGMAEASVGGRMTKVSDGRMRGRTGL